MGELNTFWLSAIIYENIIQNGQQKGSNNQISIGRWLVTSKCVMFQPRFNF